jgi:uncharacterized protein YabE (DUF348 family)
MILFSDRIRLMKKKTTWIILSVAFVIVLAAGILLMGRELSVTVDGQTTKVHTYAITVRQLLRQMGYELTTADSVSPAPGTWLANTGTVTLDRSHAFSLWVGPSGTIFQFDSPAKTPHELLALAGIEPAEDDTVKINGKTYALDDALPNATNIVLQYLPALPVSVSQNGQALLIRSSGATLGKALWAGNIRISGSDALSAPFTLPLTSAQEITLTKPTPITIQVDGMSLKSMSSAATVGEALQVSGITLQNLDYSVPTEDSPLPVDGAIRVIRVREEVKIQQESIPYTLETLTDDTMELDQQREVTPGQYGIAVTRVIIRYEDGVETSRETEASTTLVEPVKQVVAYGSKIVLHTENTDDGPITYYRKVTVFATSYSPCRSAPADGSNSCISGTSSGVPVAKGIIATTLDWYYLFKGDQIYVPGYGVGTIADTGGGIAGKNWIDLGYSDADWQHWSSWVTIYFLAPAPSNVPPVLP